MEYGKRRLSTEFVHFEYTTRADERAKAPTRASELGTRRVCNSGVPRLRRNGV